MYTSKLFRLWLSAAFTAVVFLVGGILGILAINFLRGLSVNYLPINLESFWQLVYVLLVFGILPLFLIIRILKITFSVGWRQGVIFFCFMALNILVLSAFFLGLVLIFGSFNGFIGFLKGPFSFTIYY